MIDSSQSATARKKGGTPGSSSSSAMILGDCGSTTMGEKYDHKNRHQEQQHEDSYSTNTTSSLSSTSFSKHPSISRSTTNIATPPSPHNDDHLLVRSMTRSSPASRRRGMMFIFVSKLSVISTWIVILGLIASIAFVSMGIAGAIRVTNHNFERLSLHIANHVYQALNDYVTAAAMIHMTCRNRSCTRTDFRILYEYLVGIGLDFQAAEFIPNISHSERLLIEDEAYSYYAQHYRNITYHGIKGFVEPFGTGSTRVELRSHQGFYFPVHYVEPVTGNEASIGFDRYSSISRRTAIDQCIRSGKPTLTGRLNLVQECEAGRYGVVLMHPGIQLAATTLQQQEQQHQQNHHDQTDLAGIVIRIPNLLKPAAKDQRDGYNVYLYDKSITTQQDGNDPLFLGALQVMPVLGHDPKSLLLPLNEVQFMQVKKSSKRYGIHDLILFNKEWMVVVTTPAGTFEPEVFFIVVGGIVFFIATLSLAWWVHTHAKVNRMKVDAEKAALVVENACQMAKAERELNDFVSHEVRNPVAAAMSACSFVKRAIHMNPPLEDAESIKTTREDVITIENSLKFVNDLLRNMLDIHRSTCRKLEITVSTVDILHDILEPVQAMLSQRDGKVQVTVDCPPGLSVLSDRLRLCQVMMNLGRNSVKFVRTGFIRLRARIVLDMVELSVEDSGPGIPLTKRQSMFSKYQESLDVLSQGTGVGLFLCKSLTELMGGDINLDETYHSGISQYPGARIVVNLRQPPFIDATIDRFKLTNGIAVDDISSGDRKEDNLSIHNILPNNLSILFVDDDNLLRKLFCRAVKNVCPSWTIREAANGETALRIADREQYDLIFMDMYMASVEKQLLGTETIQLLRENGYKGRICGLSANDVESEFLDAGADVFALKPFPCDLTALKKELRRILNVQEPLTPRTPYDRL